MIKVWLQKYQRFILPVLIVLIGLVVAINNYEPGTYLSGWDTLHPEFNYRLYLERVIFGAWQEHQGLGAPASQAHAAELPHVLVLMLLDVFLPTNAVRYAFFFLMYILGGLGVYWFLIKTWFNDKKQQYHLWAAFLGSLLYMFNLVRSNIFMSLWKCLLFIMPPLGSCFGVLILQLKPAKLSIFFGMQ